MEHLSELPDEIGVRVLAHAMSEEPECALFIKHHDVNYEVAVVIQL